MNACKKARPEPVKDTVYTDTFKAAFSATKAAYGYFGVCFIFGTECEMLEHLTNQILRREILDDFIIERTKAQPANAKSVVLDVHRHVQKIVKPIVINTWEQSYNAVRVLKAPFELSVKASLKQLLLKESEIRAHLEPKIRNIVLPYLTEIEHDICAPILQSCFEPVLQSYEQAVEGLQIELNALIYTVELNIEAVRAAQVALEMSIEQGSASASSHHGAGNRSSTGGPGTTLVASQKLLWTMHTEDLIDLQEIFEISGLEGFDVYSNVLDDLKQLAQNAVFTFGKLVTPTSSGGSGSDSPTMSGGKSSPNGGHGSRQNSRNNSPNPRSSRQNSSAGTTSTYKELGNDNNNSRQKSKSKSERSYSTSATSSSFLSSSGGSGKGGASTRTPVSRSSLLKGMNQVITRMCSDAVLGLRRGMVQLLVDAIEARVQESMLSPSVDEVRSAQSLVSKDMQLMVNLPSIGEGMVRDMVREFVTSLTVRCNVEATSRMQAVADRLCCANPVPRDDI